MATVGVDLHCHSRWSRDGVGSLEAIARQARARGLAGVVVTDHDTTRHHAPLAAWNRDHADAGFALYPGIEVTTRRGHLLAIGVRAAIPAGLAPQETAERIVAAGGVPVPSHPYRRRIGVGAPGLAALAPHVPAVEAWNAQETRGRNARAAQWAEATGRGATGGSDAHQVVDVGFGHTLLPDPGGRLDALLDALARGRTQAAGRRTPRWLVARQNLRILKRAVLPRAR